MPGKARVHEMATELGRSSKEIIALLSEHGLFVKSASSTIDAVAVRLLRSQLANQTATLDLTSQPAAASFVDPQETFGYLSQDPQGAAAAAARSAAARLFQIEPEQLRPRIERSGRAGSQPNRARNGVVDRRTPHQGSAEGPAPTQDVSRSSLRRNPFQVTASSPKIIRPRPASMLPDRKADWAMQMLDDSDRVKWQQAGLLAHESGLAAACIDAGITPDLLPLRLSGASALERLRSGESTAQVWARIQETLETPQRPGRLTGRFSTN